MYNHMYLLYYLYIHYEERPVGNYLVQLGDVRVPRRRHDAGA